MLLSQICLIQIVRMLFAYLGIFFLIVSDIVYEVGRGLAEAIRWLSAPLLLLEHTLTQCLCFCVWSGRIQQCSTISFLEPHSSRTQWRCLLPFHCSIWWVSECSRNSKGILAGIYHSFLHLLLSTKALHQRFFFSGSFLSNSLCIFYLFRSKTCIHREVQYWWLLPQCSSLK